MIKNCKNCGGNISFEPKKKANVCENCGSSFPIEYNYNFNKKPFSENVALKSDPFAKSIKSLKCESCGANMLLNKFETQKECPYCGNTSITESRKNKLMYIDSIIPFSFSKVEALKKLKTHINTKFYVKKAVFTKATEKDIQGMYINTFVFDLLTDTSYSGVLSYTETYKDKDGKTTSKTSYKTVNGNLEKLYNNITIEANSHIEQQDLLSIMPYEFDSAVDFKEDFMHGYLLEYEDKMFEECFKTAERIVKKYIEKDILNKYHCDNIVRLSANTTYLDNTYNYCLLPIYRVSAIYKDKKYTALINGQSGKIGKMPINVWRVLLTIFLSCGLVVGIILLVLFLK